MGTMILRKPRQERLVREEALCKEEDGNGEQCIGRRQRKGMVETHGC